MNDEETKHRVSEKQFNNADDAAAGFHEGLEEMLSQELLHLTTIDELNASLDFKSRKLGAMNNQLIGKIIALEAMGASDERIRTTKVFANLIGIGYMAVGVAICKKISDLEKTTERDAPAADKG